MPLRLRGHHAGKRCVVEITSRTTEGSRCLIIDHGGNAVQACSVALAPVGDICQSCLRRGMKRLPNLTMIHRIAEEG